MLTSVTPRVRRWFFDDCFIKNLLLTLLSKNFKNWSTFDEVMDKKVDRLKRPLRCGTVPLEDKLISSQIYGGSNCCNIIILRQSASVAVSTIDKYQTDLSTVFSLARWRQQWLTEWRSCALEVCHDGFLLCCCWSVHSVVICFFRCVHC